MISLEHHGALLRRFGNQVEATSPRPWIVSVDKSQDSTVDREQARVVWANRIVDEYRSVVVFTELLQLLAELQAPFDALCAVQRLIGDELRHTRICADVVEQLGGRDDLNIDLSDLGLPPRGDESAAVRALRIVGRELVVAEEESITMLAAYRDATTEPGPLTALEILLTDEVRHAAAGRALLSLFDSGPLGEATLSARPAVTAEMAADRCDLRRAYLASAQGGPGRRFGAALLPEDLSLSRRGRRHDHVLHKNP